MLKKTITITAILTLLTGTVNARGMQQPNENTQTQKQTKKNHQDRKKKHNKNDLINDIVSGDITQEQQADLNYMIEEEKLARDVYTALFKTSKARIFKNIADSEQKHMDAIGSLFIKYGIEVPVSLNDAGHFDNETLQVMYNDLVAQGSSSVLDALEVGVIVEETDISDIQRILDAGVPSDFARVYTNLLNGSFSHLDAFNKQLAK